MRKYPAIIFTVFALVVAPVGGVRGAALARDLAEASYGEALDADQYRSVQSTTAVVENADAIPAEVASGISGSDEVREH